VLLPSVMSSTSAMFRFGPSFCPPYQCPCVNCGCAPSAGIDSSFLNSGNAPPLAPRLLLPAQARSAASVLLRQSEASPHDDPTSRRCSPRTFTSTATAVDVYPAGIEASLLNSDDAPLTRNDGGT
jgi:hypothetical protein